MMYHCNKSSFLLGNSELKDKQSNNSTGLTPISLRVCAHAFKSKSCWWNPSRNSAENFLPFCVIETALTWDRVKKGMGVGVGRGDEGNLLQRKRDTQEMGVEVAICVGYGWDCELVKGKSRRERRRVYIL